MWNKIKRFFGFKVHDRHVPGGMTRGVRGVITRQREEINDLIKDLDISEKGIDLIIEFEGFYHKPYLDVAGIPTIGIGTIRYKSGKKVKMSDPFIKRLEANDELIYELNKKEKILNDYLEDYKYKLKQHEYDALISFAYNLGTGYFKRGKSIGNALYERNPSKVADAILLYDKARVGVFRRLKSVWGLTRRRRAERRMFLGE